MKFWHKSHRWRQTCKQRILAVTHSNNNQPLCDVKENFNQDLTGHVHNPVRCECLPILRHVPKSFKEGASPPDRPLLTRSSKIPEALPCRLVIEVRHERNKRDDHDEYLERHEHVELFDFRWQRDGQVKYCKEIVEKYIRKKFSCDKVFYLICESFTIIEQIPPKRGQQRLIERKGGSSFGNMQISAGNITRTTARHTGDHGYTEKRRYTEDISASAAWQEYLPIEVAKYLSENLEAVYFLEITLRYGSFTRHPKICSQKRDCKKVIQRVLYNNIVDTDKDRNEWFMPGQFLNKFFEKELIKHLFSQDANVREDKTWRSRYKSYEEAMNELVDFVYNCGVRMFATCLYSNLSLLCVCDLWKMGKEDRDLPIDSDDLPRRWESERDIFRVNQCRFRAHEFSRLNKAAKNALGYPRVSPRNNGTFGPTSEAIEEDETVVGIKHGVIMPFTKKEKIGQGGFSTVYKVEIHEQHHDFTPDRKQPFALKVFDKINDDDDFGKEKEVCEQLVEFPHKHLTPLISAYEQNGQFNMLFPFAEMDLHNFLKQTKSPESKTTNVEWLLQQMLGLAKGLDHLHNLRPMEKKVSQAGGCRAQTGIHHDLKPGNILVFGDDKTLKITDFGLTRIKEKMSRDVGDPKSPNSNQPVGDWEYAAPETETRNPTSRSSDIWSLGCVYLVMLLWFFGHPEDIEAFRKARRNDNISEDCIESDAFWFKRNVQFVLKKTVTDRLEWLREKAAPKRVFRELIQLIEEDMLNAHAPRERKKIVQVRSELKGLLLRARLDMKNVQNFFDDPEKGEGKIPWSLQSSVCEGTTEQGDREETQMAQNGDLLVPPAPHLSVPSFSLQSPQRLAQEPVGFGVQFFDDSKQGERVKILHGVEIRLPNDELS